MVLGVLEILLIVTSILEFNPLFQSIKFIRLKQAKSVSVWTYVMIFSIGILWLIYGFQINSVPLIIGNAIKMFASLSVIVIYFRYKPSIKKKSRF